MIVPRSYITRANLLFGMSLALAGAGCSGNATDVKQAVDEAPEASEPAFAPAEGESHESSNASASQDDSKESE